MSITLIHRLNPSSIRTTRQRNLLRRDKPRIRFDSKLSRHHFIQLRNSLDYKIRSLKSRHKSLFVFSSQCLSILTMCIAYIPSSNVTLEDVPVLSEWCPSGCDLSLILLVLVFFWYCISVPGRNHSFAYTYSYPICYTCGHKSIIFSG